MARSGSVRVSRSRDGVQDEDRRDRISDLPDTLLHQILVLLPLVEAVRTCVLSRRWRHVWTRLPRLFFFHDAAAAPRAGRFEDLVDGVLRGYADDVDMGDVFISVGSEATSVADPIRFAAAAAAPRVAARFGIFMFPDAANLSTDNEAVAVLRLPCFPKATALSLTFTGVELRLPKAGTFARLTSLVLAGARFTGDGGEGISDVVSWRCPCIRVLELWMADGLRTLTVVSKSLLSLRLSSDMELERLRVVCENLREMTVENCFVLTIASALMLLCVPALEKLHWEDCCPSQLRPWELPGCLRKLVVAELSPECLEAAGGQSNFARILQIFQRVDILRLEVPITPDNADQNNLMENVKLPYCSKLELIVNQTRHKFGPAIISLLKKSSCVKKLSLQMFRREQSGYIPCTSNCNCRQLSIWRDKGIGLISLEWVVMYEFSGTQDEKSFIYYIMRNAKGLRRVSIVLSVGVSPTRRFLCKLRKLSMSGCTVEYYTY